MLDPVKPLTTAPNPAFAGAASMNFRHAFAVSIIFFAARFRTPSGSPSPHTSAGRISLCRSSIRSHTACRSLILIVLACGPMALAQTIAPAPTTAPAIDAIRGAKDPSSAVEAYARGVAADPSHIVDLEQAYVHHMVALGAPEIADAQA